MRLQQFYCRLFFGLLGVACGTNDDGSSAGSNAVAGIGGSANGAGGNTGGDAGGAAGSGATGGGPSVQGSAVDVYASGAGDEPLPFGGSITALIPDGSGTWREVGAAVDGQGNFTLLGVPDGPYYVRRTDPPGEGSVRWLHTDARSLDLGTPFQYRSALERAAEGTGLLLTVQATNTFGELDEIDLCAPWSDVVSTVGVALTDVGLSSATFAHDLSPSALGYRAGLISAKAGDRAFVTHLVARPLAVASGGLGSVAIPVSITSALAGGEIGGAEVTSGIVQNQQISLAAGVEQTWSIDYRVSAYSALASQISTTAELSSVLGLVTVGPGEGCSILSTFLTATDGDGAGTVPVGSTFPANWEALSISFATHRVDIVGTDTTLNAFNRTVRRLPEHSLEISPLLGPPTSVELNGLPTGAAVIGAGLTPELTWQPPQLGKADWYSVWIYRLSDSRVVATISSTRATVPLPPGVLESGERYVFKVAAHAGVTSGTVRRYPYGHAEMVTAVIAP